MKGLLKLKLLAAALILSASTIAQSKEIQNPQSICQVASNYGIQAAHEKINNKDMSEKDAFTMLIYGLSKSDDFSKLKQDEKESFVKVIAGIYQYVYGDNEINEENAQEKTYQHCLKSTDKAWSRIISKISICQAKGKLYELSAMLRDTGKNKEFAKEMITNGNESKEEKDISINAINEVYSNKETPLENASRAYRSCLKE